ncbi:hypothetical protein ACFVWT_00985 [Arthrobacter sp. NPDC058288]|uniref:hypothetical protein n=1 Tax=Arthrobacter sp. NPDC058288 TaxID=3346424 RepID=UPI0036E23212
MSTPPVPPSYPGASSSGGQYGQQPLHGQGPSPFAQSPQYGQAPQYAQAPQYGQPAQYQQPQYAQAPQPQQFGNQQYTVYPSELPQRGNSGASAAPPLVNVSFWLLILACLLWAGSVFLSLGSIDDPAMRRAFEARLATSGADMDFEALQGIIVGMVVLIAAVGVLVYALVAFNIRKGRNWARILGTILAAFSLLGVLQMGLGTPSILAGVAAMVLLYLPAAAPYFRKYHPFASPYGQPGYPYGR